jgi:signal transduction histidine kinase
VTRRIVLAMTALVALVALALALPIAVIVDNDQRSAFVAGLEVDAMTAASILASQPQMGWQSTAEEVSERTGARVVVVGVDRRLIADSDLTALDRSFDRPEIDAALQGLLASDVRYSETLGVDLRFVAAPVVQEMEIVAAVRLSLPESDVDALITRTRLSLAGFIVAVVVAAALIAWILANSIAAPLRDVADVAAVLPEDLDARADTAAGPSEVRVVARTLNETAQRLSGVLRRQQRVAADASHHLRTPLTGIRLRLEAIEETAAEEDVRRNAFVAMEEVDRLHRRIDQILALAKSDAGSSVEIVDVRHVVESRIDTALTAVHSRGLDVDMSIGEGDLRTRAARGSVDRVIDELIGNAMSYARSVIGVRSWRDAGSIRLDVEDDGPGVAEADRLRIFERFVRTANAQPGGSGLGLALVRESAIGAGGDAWAEASDAGGLRICTRWPAASPDAGRGPIPR